MKIACLFGGIVVAALSTTAKADWQYTRWGMSPDQALAASKGQLKRCETNVCSGHSTDKATAQLFGPYQSGEFLFTVFALFDKTDSKLAHIMLKLKKPEKAAELIGALRTKYGEPASEDRNRIQTVVVWRDPKDQVSILAVGSGPSAYVTLIYQPRITESNKGL
jgi:hypothetical protein